MKICRWAAVLGLCLGAWSVSAQDLPDVGYTARVAGLAKGAEGRCIVWYADADMISDGRVELDRAMIGEDGRFVLATDEVFEVLP
ncbi:MAG: hypothetical protein K2I83_02515, partial [Bacteroidales bacterium]|nr:hypothetical protein [Bacteroidales bacterium]